MKSPRTWISIACLCCALVLPSLAKADACVAKSLDSLTGTCTIADKTFVWGTASSAFSGFGSTLDLSNFEFMPDTSNPLAPAFTITPKGGTSITLNAGSDADFFASIGFTVSTTDGSLALAGLDVSVQGSVSGDSSSLGTVVEAQNSSGTIAPVACIENLHSGTLLPGCSAVNGTGAPGSFLGFGAPIGSESGSASLTLRTDSTGTAVFNSARYSFEEIPASSVVPEPDTFVLLATGLTTLGAFRRRLLR